MITSIYHSYFEPITEKLGIHTWLSNLFWKIRLARHPIKRHQINNSEAKFNISSISEYQRFQSLVGEEQIIADILTEIDSDDVVFDVGANVGMYTCFFASTLSTNNIIAFEPHPINVDGLRTNLNLNERDAVIFELALADETGTADLAVKSQEVGEGEHALSTQDIQQTVQIEVAVGDNLVNSETVPMPSVIKIDVEGAELKVLRGLENTLSDDQCRLCYVEVHPDRLPKYGDKFDELEEFLKSVGFELEYLQERDEEYFIKAMK